MIAGNDSDPMVVHIADIELAPDSPIKRAAEIIETYSPRVALVVDADGRLLGTITDGDIRRGLLRGINADAPASEVMNIHPQVVRVTESRGQILPRMQTLRIRHMPVVNDQNRVIRLEVLPFFSSATRRTNPVVVMAGGEGRRLRPLTETVPKPMLPVGGRPILETIVYRLASQGFTSLYFSVNHCSGVIKQHFGNGANFGVDVTYLEEDRALGTAGSLHLMPQKPDRSFLVLNGDVLTTLDYSELLNFHQDSEATLTICAQTYQVAVPFGVLEIDDERVVALREKPLYDYFIASGIYALRPSALDLFEPGERFDMPDLVRRILETGGKVAAFPLREYWVDVGRMEDLSRARDEFSRVFGETP